jgi:hypothetical protein
VTRAAVAIGILVLAAVPARVWHYRQTANLDRVTLGVHPGMHVLDDVQYWLAERKSGWFIPSDTHILEIPIRAANPSSASCRVSVFLDDRMVNSVRVFANSWSTVVMNLPPASRGPRSRLIVLEGETEECQPMVGLFKFR